MTTEIYKFKKGEITSLDSIYEIQGLGGGRWWEKVKEKANYVNTTEEQATDMSDDIVIVEDIEIKIIINR